MLETAFVLTGQAKPCTMAHFVAPRTIWDSNERAPSSDPFSYCACPIDSFRKDLVFHWHVDIPTWVLFKTYRELVRKASSFASSFRNTFAVCVLAFTHCILNLHAVASFPKAFASFRAWQVRQICPESSRLRVYLSRRRLSLTSLEIVIWEHPTIPELQNVSIFQPSRTYLLCRCWDTWYNVCMFDYRHHF